MKKFIFAVLTILLSLLILGSCKEKIVPVVGKENAARHDQNEMTDTINNEIETTEQIAPDEVQEHQHSTNPGIWYADLTNHWHTCEKCGEDFELVPHTVVDSYCSICHMRLQTIDTNKTLLRIINNKEDVLLEKLYDHLSNELYSLRGVYTYFDSGEKSTEKIYKNGVLLYERSYNQNGAILSETKY